MAQRTLEEIQTSILDKKNLTASLSALDVLTTNEKTTIGDVNSNSKVAIWRLWVYIYSFAIWLHEGIFETHKLEIEELISLNKIHTSNWYRNEALKFQYGFNYPETEITGYDNEGVDEALIIASKIANQVSVEEVAGKLKIKVAKNGAGNVLEPFSNDEKDAFTQYIGLIKDAGTRVEIISRPPDDLKIDLDIYFDPLVLDSNGARLDGGNNTPVIESIQGYLRTLEFNGELILTKLTDQLQLVEGVKIPVISSAESRFGANPYDTINETYIADAGYMELDLGQTTINYIAREI